MVTRIEIGEIQTVYAGPNGNKSRISVCKESFKVLAEIGDENGNYQTEHGEIGASFTVNGDGHKTVELEVSGIELLRKKNKISQTISINVSGEGFGTAFLPRGRILRITTNAKFE